MTNTINFRNVFGCAGVAALAVHAAAAVSPAAIVVSSITHDVYAYAGVAGADAQNATGSAFGSLNVNDGAAAAFGSVSQSIFAITLDATQSRPGGFGSLASNYLLINFDVDADADFTLGGSYALNDLVNTQPGHAFLNIYLQDVTTATYLYSAYIESETLADPTFRFGSTTNAGTTAYDVSGSLTGALIAGHSYQFLVNASTDAFPNADSGATAAMRVVLQVPEPGTVLGTVAGLMLILGRYRNEPK